MDNGGGYAYERTGSVWDISVPLLNIVVNPKVLLKKKKGLKKVADCDDEKS